MKSLNRFALVLGLLAAASPALAQGKGKGAEKKAEKAERKSEKEARPLIVTTSNGTVITDKKTAKAIEKANRKHVTTSQAVVVTRDVLITNGYQVVNVVPSGATQVIYYRRGNRGRGRGLGPVEKIYVVPAGEVVSFRSVPDPLLATILNRLGLR